MSNLVGCIAVTSIYRLQMMLEKNFFFDTVGVDEKKF